MMREVLMVIGPSIAYLQLTQGKLALIDRRDAKRLGRWDWCTLQQPHIKDFYATRKVRDVSGKRNLVYLHREVMNHPEGITVGHKQPGNGLDCRRDNLRKATRSQQAANQRLKSSNTSGVKGVCWSKASNKWTARIKRNGKNLHLGVFIDIKEAEKVYKEAAKKIHGEFARH
jgi:hypothetical protein